MTVHVNSDVLCWIVNILNRSMYCDKGFYMEVSLKKTRKYPYEIHVPIQIISQFVKKDITKINLYAFQELTHNTK